MRTIRELLDQLPTSLEQGLAPHAVADSASRFGVNRLTPLPREPLWSKFLAKFDEPIIKILLGAALLSMIVDLFQAERLLGGIGFGVILSVILLAWAIGRKAWIPSLMFLGACGLFIAGLSFQHFLVEGMAVMIAVILATGVSFASEYKSDREFEALNAGKESLQAKVMRGGEFHTIALEAVVVGDVVLLEMGDEIPADGRVLKATEWYVDQSLMTGESAPVRKLARPSDETAEGPDQPGCLYRGTQVVDGAGQMLATEVGDATALGQIARHLSADESPDESSTDAETKRIQRKLTISKELTPLQLKLKKLADLISLVGYIAAVLIFLAQVLHGLLARKIYWTTDPDGMLQVFGVLLSYAVNMVIIIVVAVPEGLPMSVTVSLALAMRKMTRANSLVRQLVACETIGSATVICTDKTGTLTQNKMQVVKVVSSVHKSDGTAVGWMSLNAAANSTANLELKEGRLVGVGNSTEGALLHWVQQAGQDYRQLRQQFPPLYQLHFSSERKRMTTVIRQGERLVVLAKGSPEWILANSSHYLAEDGAAHPWTTEIRQEFQRLLNEAASQAMRTLAFAYALLPETTSADEERLHEQRDQLESGLIFTGFVAIRDPLRDDVKEALIECRCAGIEVKMVTGDNLATARAIALDAGLIVHRDLEVGADKVVMTSEQFNAFNDDQLKPRLGALRILARARPLDKYRLVRLLQELGEVVAVTGDGTNDAPALKKADVGLAMGIAGTEVAKEASKIVLLDDSFATIVKAVHWGRSLYENIQRFIQFQLTINVSALAIYLLGTLLFQVEAPFTVLQLLWINVIMDTFASIALCSEPPREGVMLLPPKKRTESIVTRPMWISILATSGFYVAVMLSMLLVMKGNPHNPGQLLGTHEGPWAVEVGGSRFAAASHDLTQRRSPTRWEDIWYIHKDPLDPALREVADREVEIAFTVLQVSVFFSVYVFFQVWNLINCRSLTPDHSGLYRLFANPTFLTIAALIALGQIAIVTFGGPVFKVQPLNVVTWIAIATGTASVLLFAEIARHLRKRLLT